MNKPPPLPPKRPERADPLVGRTISERYRIDAILAAGGMGTVYSGEHVHMQKRVAIKVLRPSMESFPELVSRFEREAIAGAHVGHANVASATDFGRLEDGSYFLILEYVPGMTLHDLIKKGPVAPVRAAHIARQIAAGLDACHRMGVIHRDLKPRNVMIDEERGDLVKIIDFGLARVPMHKPTPRDGADHDEPTRRQITLRGIVFGTVAYMAPETALGMEAVDERSDLYALGIILYELLAGRHPFDAVDPAELFLNQRATLPPVFSARAPEVDVPPAIEAVVRRLLEKKPADRYPCALDVADALDRAILGSNPEFETTPANHSVSLRAALARTVSRPSADVTPTPVSSSRVPTPESATDALVEEAAPRPPLGSFSRAALQSARFRAVAVAGTLLLLGAAIGLRWSAPWLGSTTGAPATSTEALRAQPMLGTALETASRVASDARRAEESARWRARLRDAQTAKNTRGIAVALTALAQSEPAAFRDRDVAEVAAAAAIRLEFEDDHAADGLFDALAELGADGADILYEIASTKGGSKGAKRANEILSRAGVRARVSKELAIAIDLRDARCDEKKALFERAGREGDFRTLRLLEQLRSPGSCSGGGQCCYWGASGLEKAAAAILRRL